MVECGGKVDQMAIVLLFKYSALRIEHNDIQIYRVLAFGSLKDKVQTGCFQHFLKLSQHHYEQSNSNTQHTYPRHCDILGSGPFFENLHDNPTNLY